MRYALQKLIREVLRNPDTRERFMREPGPLLESYNLSEEERSALLARDFAALYDLGVHGLLLRPFSIIFGVPEPEYLNAIRGASHP